MRIQKFILTVIFLLSLVELAFSQDIILKKDNTTILTKVLEITSTEIKYKKWSNQDGPTYSISRSEVMRINYQNGELEKFNDNETLKTSPVNKPTTTYQQLKTQTVKSEVKPKYTNSPYSRGIRINKQGQFLPQFSISVGVCIPNGYYGTTSNHANLDDLCAPFSMFSETLGTTNEIGYGAAKTGISGSIKLHFPFYENGKSIIGIPMKFNVLYNGITDSEKQVYRQLWENLVSSQINEEYGINAYQLKITDFSSYLNFDIMFGVDYTFYISNPFALFVEANIGMNINKVTTTKMQNQLAGTYISQYHFYSEKELSVKYKAKPSFAYEIGGGLYLFERISLGVFYSRCVPVQLKCDITLFDGEQTLKKLQPSTLSIQLGIHF